MEAIEYAIVDIETTGAYAAGSSITEIAILIHDGQGVTASFETLLQPEHDIPYYIQVLTGIDEEMLRKAPSFSSVAEKVYELLSGRIFVAHNVNFDYSFLKHHLAAEGYDLNTPKLCTVRMSRKIRPGLKSYSLGRLCESLDIPMNNRHRAGGDAAATAVLFSHLLNWDTDGHIRAMLKANSKDQVLPPNLPREHFEALPGAAGVYYFRNKAGKAIYVGKATNIRKRVSTHFGGHNPNARRQHFLQEIYAIDFILCGTELMALLLEAAEIKRLWPKYNQSLKRYEPRFGLYTYEDINGYQRLAIGKLAQNQLAVQTFTTHHDAINLLHKLVRHSGLCPELCKLGPCNNDCHMAAEGKVCKAKSAPEGYNELVQQALQLLHDNMPSYMIMDKGRNEDEYSCIWIEKGAFYGMGFFSKYIDLQSPEDIKSVITPYTGNHYMLQLAANYAEKHPYKVRRFDMAQ